ncbi:helix-turn-helix transcriptional regulator [Arthrobacter citreus]|nr:helix-turn-helix transcriptional regulator [Arthrobacter citreus]
MVEGKIIQFYRQHRNINQSDLGEGICSATHISKIERGLTEVSDQTITLIAERLNINMEDEIKKFMSLERLLNDWFQSIIMKIAAKADRIKEQLEEIPLIHLSNFVHFYTLILTKYYLLNSNEKLAKINIKNIEQTKGLSEFEKNLHLHNKAIFQLKFKNDYVEAISLLKQINTTEYDNKEFYYDLASAYHYTNSRVLAFYYGNKALQFFTESQCFSRMIEAENLMLVQLEETDKSNTSDKDYHRLIELSLQYGLNNQMSTLYHNLAYHQILNDQYTEASVYYEKSMQLKDKDTKNYLLSLEGYINSMTKGKLIPNKDLLPLVEEGLLLAERIGAQMHIHIFKLHQFTLLNLEYEYFYYLETEALPYYYKIGITDAIEHYQLKLFDYYMEKQNRIKADEYAKKLLNKFRNNNSNPFV